MKANAVIGQGILLALSGFAIGRLGIRNVAVIGSNGAFQLLIVACVVAGLVLVLVGIVRKPLR